MRVHHLVLVLGGLSLCLSGCGDDDGFVDGSVDMGGREMLDATDLPSLASLTVDGGAALSPQFFPFQMSYVVTLPPGATSTTLTLSAAQVGATITVDGVSVASGGSVVVSHTGSTFDTTLVAIIVTSTAGRTRPYSLRLSRGPTYVKASNPGAGDAFGYTVALSSDGTRLAVGARREASGATGVDGAQTDDGTPDSGAVYVYARVGATWAQEAYLKASNTGPYDNLGWSLALSSDGTRLAVGAYGESSSATGLGGAEGDEGAPISGAVYVFARSGTTWTQEAYVKASNTGADDRFGWSVALSGDGARLAVGALGEDSSARGLDGAESDEGATDSGAVYVFARDSAGWAQEAYVKASNTGALDGFGAAVSLSRDGTRLVVGAYREGSGARGVGGSETSEAAMNSGAAYVFSRDSAGWTQEAYVKASNTGSMDEFGFAVSLDDDGARLAVAAHYEAARAYGIDGDQANDDALGAGAVYVFARAGATWSQEAYVKASNPQENALFGGALSLSADGTHLAVGAYYESSSWRGIGADSWNTSSFASGAAYVFARSATAWAQTAYVKAPNADSSDFFGYALSLSADGAHLAVGAWGESSAATGIDGDQADNSGFGPGAAYLY